MRAHELRPQHAKKSSKRIGRGGKRGTYSGRGMKGQKSRSGARFQPLVRESIKRYHKLRGYRARSGSTLPSFNLGVLEKNFQAGETVSPAELVKRGLAPRGAKLVKLLGSGELTKALTVEGCGCSATAKAAIEKAGGSVK
ncbi:MAG: uL15 family ribosomal protein [bacterium]|nr:uL15 family ribosomal protein [bacterium]MDZ4231810.1 uL15 family ribosomal protein [Candidatus Pacearchaeota archaeon]